MRLEPLVLDSAAVFRDMARGLLLVLMAVSAAIVSGPFLVSLLGGPVAYRSPAALLTQPICFVRTSALVQALVLGGFTSLAAYGLHLLARGQRDGAARAVRAAAALLFLPLVVRVLPALLIAPLPELSPASRPTTAELGTLLSAHLAAGSLAEAVNALVYGVAALVVLRFLQTRLPGTPRPRLARFARPVFSGLLICTALAALGSGLLAWSDWSASAPGTATVVLALAGGTGTLAFGLAGLLLLVMTRAAFLRAAAEGPNYEPAGQSARS